ncbi:MAG: tetratricopeptide repeat protein [Rhodanobacteraceae bacterium]
MNRRNQWVGILLGVAVALLASSAHAQIHEAQGNTLTPPDYGSGASAGALSNTNFNTPESDGRPGVEDYKEGMAAYHRGDFTHAVYMLKVAASWAYEPADYNLGVMYFQGDHVAENRSLGTAWMFIAAERGAQTYVDARHMMVTSLDYAERTQALAYYQQLQKKYGDKLAMRRARAQWAFAKTDQTGTRVGGTVGELRVGITAAHGSFSTPSTGGGGAVGKVSSSWTNVLTGGSTDGSVAYQQLHQSNNPYNPVFLKNRTGTATVGPLQTVKGNAPGSASSKSDKKATISGQNPGTN